MPRNTMPAPQTCATVYFVDVDVYINNNIKTHRDILLLIYRNAKIYKPKGLSTVVPTELFSFPVRTASGRGSSLSLPQNMIVLRRDGYIIQYT